MNECRLCDKALSPHSNALEDTILLENEHFLCIPALGALLPGYVLLVSRRHVISIAQLKSYEILALNGMLAQLTQLPIYQAGHLFFEHGSPNAKGGGACIHHYHIHFAPRNNLTLLEVEESLDFPTRRVTVPDVSAIREHKLKQGYLLISDGRSTVCHISDEIPRQLMRRILANHLGISEQWNWAIYPHLDRVAKTVDAVRQK